MQFLCDMLKFMRASLVIATYVGAMWLCMIIVSGPGIDNRHKKTPGVQSEPITSVPLLCVVITALLFLIMHSVLYMDNPQARGTLTASFAVRSGARDSVLFCPMVCVMFLLVRWRSLQLSDGHGQPQAWVCVVAVSSLGGVLVRFVTGVAAAAMPSIGNTPHASAPEDGHSSAAVQLRMNRLARAMSAIEKATRSSNMVSSLLVYMCMIALVLGNCLMTKANTSGMTYETVLQDG